MKIGVVVAEIFSRIRFGYADFRILVQQNAILTLAISGVIGPNVIKIVHNVEKFILFNILKSEL